MFWTSIKTEEGRSIQIRIFYVDPGNPDPNAPPWIRSDRWRIFSLAQHINFTVSNLVKLAKAADPWSSGLAVFHTPRAGLFIWGMVDQVIHLSMAIVQEGPGYYTPPGSFQAIINGAADITILRQDSFIARLTQNVIIDKQNDCLWEGIISDFLTQWVKPLWKEAFKMVGNSALTGWRPYWRYEAKELWAKTLSRILINIQRQRHGGAILFCPQELCQDLSVKYEIDYRIVPEQMKSLLLDSIRLHHTRDKLEWQRNGGRRNIPRILYANESVFQAQIEDSERSLTGAVKFISSMAGVDGLILASPDFAIRGFGVEIMTKQDLLELTVTSSANMQDARKMNATSYGTRHRSMSRYCSKYPSSLGFVVSQDGDIRAIMKVGEQTVLFENMKVHSLWGDDVQKMIDASKS